MCIVKLNPAVLGMHGRIGSMVFYQRMGMQCARIYVIPHNPDTAKQRSNRNLFRDAISTWQSLSTEEKISWNSRAGRKNYSGYNLFISYYMKKDKISGTDSFHEVSTVDSIRDNIVLPSYSLRFPSVIASFQAGSAIENSVLMNNPPGNEYH